MARLGNGLLRNLVFEANAVEEIIIYEKLIPLQVVLEKVRPRTVGAGSSWWTEHRINRCAAPVTGR